MGKQSSVSVCGFCVRSCSPCISSLESRHLGGVLSSVAVGDVVAACFEAFWIGSSLCPRLR